MFALGRGIRRTLLATAAIGMVMGSGSVAYAGAMAVSILEISAFQIIDANTGTQLTINIPGVVAGDITVLGGNNSADASATLDGVNLNTAATAPATVGPAFGAIDIPQQCVGACPPFAENSFSGVGVTPPPGSNYALSDLILFGSALDLTAIGGPAGGTTSMTRADVALMASGVGSSTTNTGTNVAFSFTANDDLDVQFTMDFVRHLVAHLNSHGFAEASSSWSLDLEDLTAGSSQTWSPTELNALVSRSIDGLPDANSLLVGSLISPIFTLLEGNLYQLTIRHTTEADASLSVVVTEPVSAALFGIGLLGLGLMNRRRRVTA